MSEESRRPQFTHPLLRRSLHKRRRGPGLAKLLAMPLAVAGGWIAYSQLAIDHDVALPKAIEAERKVFVGPNGGVLSYYTAPFSGGGVPLILLHAINAAGSSYEMRPLFQHYQGTRPLFALDWPGFGFSERSDRVYSPELYQNALVEFLGSQVNAPADVVALSLGCEFAALAARAQPERFRSLTLISPSGFSTPGQRRASQEWNQNDTSQVLYRAFSFPLWGQAFFDLIASRPSIHYFLAQSFVGDVDPGLEEYDYATSHQPGAHLAPLYFVSGQLFTRDILSAVYDHLTVPVQVLYDEDAFVTFDRLPEVTKHPNWRAVQILPTRGLPQFEKPAETIAALDQFWSGMQ